MDPIERLMAEHRVIERVLDALEAYAARVDAGDAEAKDALLGFVEFLRGYADAHHHGKEEDLLFERLCESGFSREAGPIAVMLHEHVEGRALVGTMRELATREASWGEAERGRVARSAAAFARLLRSHIQKEDQVLYPMARGTLPAGAWQALTEAFSAHAKAHANEEGRLENLARELEARWLEG